MNDGNHLCQASACKAEVPQALLMCKDHWSRLPTKLKLEVYRTWRKFNEASPRLRGDAYAAQERADRLREYQKARKDAIAFVDALEPK